MQPLDVTYAIHPLGDDAARGGIAKALWWQDPGAGRYHTPRWRVGFHSALGVLVCVGFFLIARGALGAGGDLLWEDRFDVAGGLDEVFAITAGGGQVFAGGSGTNAAGNRDFLVRAYDAQTGALLWQDQLDLAGSNDEAFAIAVAGGLVVATGVGTTATGNENFLVRVYAAQTGVLLWEDEFDVAGGLDDARTVAVEGGQVFAAGIGTNAAGNWDFLVRAYLAE